MELNFRTLRANEIECKATIVRNKIEISLHSRASTCTRILNEEVGVMNWEKEYTNGNKNCIVRIWDAEKARMISKEDCGGPLTDINGQKGQASNGFKRVCALGWGLGIELYSQPEIMLPKTDNNVTYDDKGNPIVSERYYVSEIEYDEDKHITRCVIVDSSGAIVYDGPNENGESNVVIEEPEEEVLVIPEDADVQNSDSVVEEYDEDLPDNTDGFDAEHEDCVVQPTPFGTVNYRKELENEIQRTHVKKSDVLGVLKIDSFEEIHMVNEELLDETIRKLKAMKTYGK
jgi:hypothetical protein